MYEHISGTFGNTRPSLGIMVHECVECFEVSCCEVVDCEDEPFGGKEVVL